MPMTKEERLARKQQHTKQERISVLDGVPSSDEVREGVPVLRDTNEGLIEYVKHKGVLHATPKGASSRTVTTFASSAVRGSGVDGSSPSSGFSGDHGVLTGLGDDDHTTYILVDGTRAFSGRAIVDDTTEATSTTDGSLQTDGGLSVVKDAIFGNDVKLLTDASVFSMGVGSDFTITHDNTTGATLAASPITINSTGDMTLDSTTDIILDAAGDQVYFKDNGTTRIVVNLDGSPEMDVTGNFTIDGSATITLDSVGNFIVKTDASQRFKVDTGGHAYFHNFEGTFTGGEALFNDYKINNLADNYHFVTAFDDLKQNYVLLAEDTESAAGTFNPGYGS